MSMHHQRPTNPILGEVFDAIRSVMRSGRGAVPRSGGSISYKEACRRALEENRRVVEERVRELEAKPRLTRAEASQLRGYRELLASGKMGPSAVAARAALRARDRQSQTRDGEIAERLQHEIAAIKRELAERELANTRHLPGMYRGPF